MKKCLIVTAMLFAAMTAFGQSKPGLGILPFSGGRGNEGDTIASLFANSADLGKAFDVYLRTSSAQAIDREHEIQRTGLTDSDNIARMGRQMNVDYVVSGHITRLGNANLLLISIIDVETMEQIAGDQRPYNAIGNVRAMLPDMAAKIIASVRQKPSDYRMSLAVLPLAIQDQLVNREDAEVLANILATEIANTHKYIVLPRTTTIEAALTEQSVQQNSGYTSRENLAAIGKATNARYVLSGTITYLGNTNLFDVKILDIESAGLIVGDDAEYRNLEDGVEIMRDMARNITGVTKEEAAAAAEKKRQAVTDAERWARVEDARRKRIDVSLSLLIPLGLSLSASYDFSPFPYTLVDLGLGFGIGKYEWEEEGVRYESYPDPDNYGSNKWKAIPDTYMDEYTFFILYPYAHFNGYLPVARNVVLFAGAGLSVAFDFTTDVPSDPVPDFDLTAGTYLFDRLKLSYTLRIPLRELNDWEVMLGIWHCIGIGYSF